jgi:UDP-3-O-[3-hydroxymyristoyl] N-acetylglucosamine deacetylase
VLITKKGRLTGIGVHGGKKAVLWAEPASVGAGICFSVDGKDYKRLSIDQIRADYLCTSIKNDDFEIRTIEHLLAALRLLEIYDINLSVDGGEIPIMDGSARDFVQFFESLGLVDSDLPKPIIVLDACSVYDDDKFVSILPYDGFRVTYTVDYLPSILGVQTYVYEQGVTDVKAELSHARTFGHEADLEVLNKQGLALGSSIENALGVGKDNQYMNEPRFFNEAVRHKTLDLIGDLSVIGKPITGHVIAYKSSHKLNQVLLKKLMI